MKKVYLIILTIGLLAPFTALHAQTYKADPEKTVVLLRGKKR